MIHFKPIKAGLPKIDERVLLLLSDGLFIVGGMYLEGEFEPLSVECENFCIEGNVVGWAPIPEHVLETS